MRGGLKSRDRRQVVYPNQFAYTTIFRSISELRLSPHFWGYIRTRSDVNELGNILFGGFLQRRNKEGFDGKLCYIKRNRVGGC